MTEENKMTHLQQGEVIVPQRSFSEIQAMAEVVSKGGAFGQMTPQQVMSLMMLSEASGLHPMKCVQRYHIISGKASMKSESMQAKFQKSGGKVEWIELSAEIAKAKFSHPSGGTVTIDWTIEMAKNAGLMKNPTWAKYPRAMLKARCISEGGRTVFPAAADGLYTEEEVHDIAIEEKETEAKVLADEAQIKGFRKALKDAGYTLTEEEETLIPECSHEQLGAIFNAAKSRHANEKSEENL